MNLSTAQSASRAREVGLRKTFGADRTQIIIQFIGESVILSLIAMCVAVGLAEFMLPWFNTLLDTNLSVDYLNNPHLIFMLIGLAVFVGLLAGSYPAFYLSGFSASSLLKGELTRGGGGVKRYYELLS